MRTRVHAALISILLGTSVLLAPLASSVHADEPTPAASLPIFLRTELYYPAHSIKLGGNTQFQKALRDGDSVYVVVTIDNTVVTTVTADLSALGGSSETILADVNDYIDVNTSPNLLRQFQSEWFPVSSGASTGTRTITFTATDSNGVVVTRVVDVVLDQAPPTLSISSVGRTSTTTLKQFDTLTLSGTIDGSGSDARIYSIRAQEMNTDGSTVLHESYYGWDHPSSPELYALRGGDFTNIPIRLYTANGAMDFPADTSNLRYILTLEDDAGNVTYATSSLISLVAPPPEPEGPQISNVLFLPGIKGSRLYDATGATVWEPGSDQDVEKLFLTSAGVGASAGIHTKSGDIIETIAGFSEIYGSFIRSMNELQSTDKIKEWRIASYDWRLSLDDLVSKGVVRDDNIYFDETADVPYLELNLLELASSSPTHKVTIIAHSNGGLVAKKLLMKLGDAETSRLIDKVVFVGVPQSGAPQALGALLFGYKESLPSWFPFIVHISTARTFAENSPMGYHLLPSQRYFDDVLDEEHAVVQFNAASTYAEERAKYGTVINTWEELSAFSLAEDNGRTKPEAVLFFKPNVLNDFLLTYAKRTHDALDAWVPPTGVTLYQIGGWGKETVSGIEFYELCVLSVCKKEYRPTFVQHGDRVVPIQSALMLSTAINVKKFWVDLDAYGFGPIGNKDHGSFLSVTDVQNFLSNIILGDPALPQNIFTEQPTSSISNKRLRFMLHSPLTLNLYDASGNHAGPTASGGSEETIPGSAYGQFGEVQYVTVPAGPEYTVKMNGIASGTFSLDIQEVSGGSIVASTTLAGVPTQAGTIAKITIGDSLTTISSLSVDSDGNGVTDFTLPVSQNSTSFYQAPAEAVTVPISSGGSSKSSTSSPAQETSTIATAPPLAVHTTPIAPQPAERVTQMTGANQKEPIVTSQTISEEPHINGSSQVASPLSVFYEIKDIFISMLVGVYHFIIRIGSFLFTR